MSLKFGIPDIELASMSGMKINPSNFAGHELVVLFGPLEPVEEEREIAAYRQHCAEFVDRDAWLLAFTEHCGQLNVDGASRVLTISDPDRRAWTAFCNLTHHAEEMDRSNGATFLFTRGGGMHRYWPGSGHVNDLLAELRLPSSEYPRQFAR